MARVTVYVPDDLWHNATGRHPDLNKSAVFQAGLRALERCDHDELTCRCCGDAVTRADVAGQALSVFYVSILNRFRERIDQPGYSGAARLIRNLAADHGVPAVLANPLPRPSRAQLEARADAEVAELPTEAASRRRHPTNKERTA